MHFTYFINNWQVQSLTRAHVGRWTERKTGTSPISREIAGAMRTHRSNAQSQGQSFGLQHTVLWAPLFFFFLESYSNKCDASPFTSAAEPAVHRDMLYSAHRIPDQLHSAG
jgi:hypothetical protein